MRCHFLFVLLLLMPFPIASAEGGDDVYWDADDDEAVDFVCAPDEAPYGELVLYPMLSLDNHTFDRIYHYSLSVAPALELHPWQGAKWTGQVVLPLWSNDGGSEQRRVRAGVNTLQQELRLHRRLMACVTVGLFTHHRAGVDLRAAWLWLAPDHPLVGGGACCLTAQAGYTGLFICDSRLRYFERWNQWSGAYGIDFYHRQFFTRVEMQCIYDLNGRQGWRLDWTRLFRRAAVGFYGTIIDRDYNVGFHFAVRLPSVERRRDARLRVRAPYCWDWQYTMKSKSYYQGYGNNYEISPNWHHASFFWRELCPSALGPEW